MPPRAEAKCLKFCKTIRLRMKFPVRTKRNFGSIRFRISLSGLFYETNFAYTFEEYTEHLQLTKAFAAEHASYSAVQARDNAFVNIQILMHENDFVMISKNTAPDHSFCDSSSGAAECHRKPGISGFMIHAKTSGLREQAGCFLYFADIKRNSSAQAKHFCNARHR